MMYSDLYQTTLRAPFEDRLAFAEVPRLTAIKHWRYNLRSANGHGRMGSVKC